MHVASTPAQSLLSVNTMLQNSTKSPVLTTACCLSTNPTMAKPKLSVRNQTYWTRRLVIQAGTLSEIPNLHNCRLGNDNPSLSLQIRQSLEVEKFVLSLMLVNKITVSVSKVLDLKKPSPS